MVTPITLQSFSADDKDYVARLNNNATVSQGKINEIVSLLNGVLGDGAELTLDLWDRDGLVGSRSYVLDIPAYAGGAQIKIGHRPAADPLKGELDLSVAWASFDGARQRVTMTGDLTLDASGITGGLPKTIYVGIPANGTPQLFEDNVTPNILYAYSMTWDGYGFEDIKRTCPLLDAYTLLQDIVGQPRLLQLFDGDTDWVSDATASSEIVIPGDGESNGLGLPLSHEVLGFFLHAGKAGEDGFDAPEGSGDNVRLKLRVTSEGETWSESDLELLVDNVPDSVFVPVAAALGDRKYVCELQRFTLERVSIGPWVVSARAFTWGLVVRPIIGIQVPKDSAKVDQV